MRTLRGMSGSGRVQGRQDWFSFLVERALLLLIVCTGVYYVVLPDTTTAFGPEEIAGLALCAITAVTVCVLFVGRTEWPKFRLLLRFFSFWTSLVLITVATVATIYASSRALDVARAATLWMGVVAYLMLDSLATSSRFFRVTLNGMFTVVMLASLVMVSFINRQVELFYMSGKPVYLQTIQSVAFSNLLFLSFSSIRLIVWDHDHLYMVIPQDRIERAAVSSPDFQRQFTIRKNEVKSGRSKSAMFLVAGTSRDGSVVGASPGPAAPARSHSSGSVADHHRTSGTIPSSSSSSSETGLVAGGATATDRALPRTASSESSLELGAVSGRRTRAEQPRPGQGPREKAGGAAAAASVSAEAAEVVDRKVVVMVEAGKDEPATERKRHVVFNGDDAASEATSGDADIDVAGDEDGPPPVGAAQCIDVETQMDWLRERHQAAVQSEPDAVRRAAMRLYGLFVYAPLYVRSRSLACGVLATLLAYGYSDMTHEGPLVMVVVPEMWLSGSFLWMYVKNTDRAKMALAVRMARALIIEFWILVIVVIGAIYPPDPDRISYTAVNSVTFFICSQGIIVLDGLRKVPRTTRLVMCVGYLLFIFYEFASSPKAPNFTIFSYSISGDVHNVTKTGVRFSGLSTILLILLSYVSGFFVDRDGAYLLLPRDLVPRATVDDSFDLRDDVPDHHNDAHHHDQDHLQPVPESGLPADGPGSRDGVRS